MGISHDRLGAWSLLPASLSHSRGAGHQQDAPPVVSSLFPLSSRRCWESMLTGGCMALSVGFCDVVSLSLIMVATVLLLLR